MKSLGVSQSLESDFQPLIQIQRLVTQTAMNYQQGLSCRHSPIIIVGNAGVGKTTALAQAFTYSTQWLEDVSSNGQFIRVVRLLGRTPCSSYSSELLRSLCLHISVAFGLDIEQESEVGADAGSLSNRFQEILRSLESSDSGDSHLMIILDDLQELKSIQTSSILSWMPWTLPGNVHLICSVSSEESSILSILKSRIPSENFIRVTGLSSASASLNMIQSKLRDEKRSLTQIQWEVVRKHLTFLHRQEQHGMKDEKEGKEDVVLSSEPESGCQVEVTPFFLNLLSSCILSNWASETSPLETDILPSNVYEIVDHVLEELEQDFGRSLLSKFCLYISFSRYGFRENEVLELISSDQQIRQNPASLWFCLKQKMSHGILREFFVMGRNYYSWSHRMIGEAVKKRYISSESTAPRIHSELAQAFFLGFSEVSSISWRLYWIFESSCMSTLPLCLQGRGK
jgi:hypothetical protein